MISKTNKIPSWSSDGLDCIAIQLLVIEDKFKISVSRDCRWNGLVKIPKSSFLLTVTVATSKWNWGCRSFDFPCNNNLRTSQRIHITRFTTVSVEISHVTMHQHMKTHIWEPGRGGVCWRFFVCCFRERAPLVLFLGANQSTCQYTTAKKIWGEFLHWIFFYSLWKLGE